MPNGGLVAILAADCGHSRLVEADEVGTLDPVKLLRSNVIDPLLAEYHGRVVNLMGDSAIIEFSSVFDAVACAAALQRALAAGHSFSGVICPLLSTFLRRTPSHVTHF